MKICILGAGVVGLTAAWWLTEAGHDVVVVDRQSEPGAEASAANGAQLSYRFVAPMASPAMLTQLPLMLLPGEGAIRVSLNAELAGWGLRFLKACTTAEYRRTTAAQLALADLSRRELERLMQAVPLSFGLRTAGKLVLYRKAADFAAAQGLPDAETEQQALTPAQCLALEPGLTLAAGDFVGGIYTPSEQVGDCGAFCRQLAAQLQGRVRFSMGTTIGKPVIRNGRLMAVETDRGPIDADMFVLSLGSGSKAFAKACGFHLPIYPMKGHSITVADAKSGTPPLTHSVTDYSRKIVYAPLDGATRVAGFADFKGYDRAPDASRIAQLKSAAADTFGIDASGSVAPWAGLRPLTPDSRPVIGASSLDGLFYNTGHGGLGWTLACGSARLAADLIDGRPPSCPPQPFSPERF